MFYLKSFALTNPSCKNFFSSCNDKHMTLSFNTNSSIYEYCKIINDFKSKFVRINFSRLYVVGLGYKNFILNNFLYILVGDCNYTMFKIPPNIKVFCRKSQLYFLSDTRDTLGTFVSFFRYIKKLNLYKGKGFIHFKNFKFTKLKIGKKQRF